jgi:hypothetical protein
LLLGIEDLLGAFNKVEEKVSLIKEKVVLNRGEPLQKLAFIEEV